MDNLKTIQVKSSYNSDTDNILGDFYIPALSVSKEYFRIAGFFSSTSFALASRGLENFINNEGKVKMIVNKVLQKDDKKMLSIVYEKPQAMERMILDDYENWTYKDKIIQNHVLLFGWMLKNKKLELKIAITSGDELFHQKIGILKDDLGNQLSFSGSNNETASGWKTNIEEFKVFREWRTGEKQYFDSDVGKFDHFWNNKSKRALVIDAPKALTNKLIKEAPQDYSDLKLNSKRLQVIIEKHKTKNIKSLQTLKKSKIKTPYDFQKKAIKKWTDNNRVGILEMATGTGKTFTSVYSVKELGKKEDGYCVIICVPYTHLISQWEKEVKETLENFTLLKIGGGVSNWDRKLEQYLTDYNDGFLKNLIIITTYDSLSLNKSTNILNKHVGAQRPLTLVADEVHNIGSKKRSKIMGNFFKYRLGLSATPLRHMDDEGSELITKYFGGSVYKYSLSKAIKNGFLTPYKYYPRFVQLTEDEYEKYYEISKKISKVSKYKSDFDKNDYLKRLLIKRSRILKNAENKIASLHNLLSTIQSQTTIDHLLIYFDSIKQIDKSRGIIDDLGLITHKFTQMENKSQRETILQNFDSGAYQCLLAIKCLDEGVNVPSTRTAIIVASTTNPREYIQRRGRVLRKYKDKKEAIVFDLTVLPPSSAVKDIETKDIERKLIKKELNRIQEFLNTAKNKTEIFNEITDVMIKYDVYLD
jgi:superfamily II DNA or RNA helicase